MAFSKTFKQILFNIPISLCSGIIGGLIVYFLLLWLHSVNLESSIWVGKDQKYDHVYIHTNVTKNWLFFWYWGELEPKDVNVYISLKGTWSKNSPGCKLADYLAHKHYFSIDIPLVSNGHTAVLDSFVNFPFRLGKKPLWSDIYEQFDSNCTMARVIDSIIEFELKYDETTNEFLGDKVRVVEVFRHVIKCYDNMSIMIDYADPITGLRKTHKHMVSINEIKIEN